jgi:hypothetical protein
VYRFILSLRLNTLSKKLRSTFNLEVSEALLVVENRFAHLIELGRPLQMLHVIQELENHLALQERLVHKQPGKGKNLLGDDTYADEAGSPVLLN